MKQDEIERILACRSCKIIAPAGHGKTEIISELVSISEGTHLVLTHTNAGVDAIQKRMLKNHVPKNNYSVFTIAGFCLLWSTSFPSTAQFDTSLSLSKQDQAKLIYSQLYRSAKSIFTCKWAQDILINSFSSLIVDEYQDCTIEQDDIVQVISSFLPVRVLGDPMQAIFQWAGPLVDMNELSFPEVKIETKPWRWKDTNPHLGEWISDIRKTLEPTLFGERRTLNLLNITNCLTVLPSTNFNGFTIRDKLSAFETVAYITAFEPKQLDFARRMAGTFQNDETQVSNILFSYAADFSTTTKVKLCTGLINFLESCATHITTEFSSYISNLRKNSCDFTRIKKHVRFGEILSRLYSTSNLQYVIDAIEYVMRDSCFHVYRKEVLHEMVRAIEQSLQNRSGLVDAMTMIRHNASQQNRYGFYRRLSTRTILSKGLEFDCVIVDLSKPLPPRDFYVAISRAKKMVYILSDSRRISMLNKCMK